MQYVKFGKGGGGSDARSSGSPTVCGWNRAEASSACVPPSKRIKTAGSEKCTEQGFPPLYSCQSGITHTGGAVSFLRRASSAISCILSKEVSLINLEADWR